MLIGQKCEIVGYRFRLKLRPTVLRLLKSESFAYASAPLPRLEAPIQCDIGRGFVESGLARLPFPRDSPELKAKGPASGTSCI